MKPTFKDEDLFREAIGPLWDARQGMTSLEGEDILAMLQPFSAPEKLVFSLAELDAEGGGGGWDCFVRVSGYLLPLLVEALDSVGPEAYLPRAREILALFPDASSVANNALREAVWEGWFNERADELTNEFFETYDEYSIRECAEAYIREHMADFFATGNQLQL